MIMIAYQLYRRLQTLRYLRKKKWKNNNKTVGAARTEGKADAEMQRAEVKSRMTALFFVAPPAAYTDTTTHGRGLRSLGRLCIPLDFAACW